MNRLFAGLLISSFLALSACDDSSSPSSPGPSSEGPLSQLDSLFAPPTAAETTLIASQWAARAVQVQGAKVESSFNVSIALPMQYTSIGVPASWTLPASVDVRVISHVVDGFRHNGILYVPEGNGPFPVLVFAHGDDDGIDNTQWSMLLQAMGSLCDSVAIIAPSFRSEPVSMPSSAWLSEGTPSPWDRDIDDMRGLLRACAKLDAKLDTSRVTVAGYSRGGGVALLAAERDPIFKSVATIAAPTSFQGPWVHGLAESLLAGDTIDLPGVDFIDSTVLLALHEHRISMDSARRELIRRSAVTWASRLPAQLQLHHGYADITVPSDELVRLQAALQTIGRSPDVHFWPNKTHLTVLFSALPEVRTFVSSQLLH